ncbi:hypothetical protein [Promicromonospora sp. NPDC019610]|uniref:hypothetical protein n=1 Tax=Promicromonospora sp. NPDC019610 TaxID=3364405 RepID=UPI0037B0F525
MNVYNRVLLEGVIALFNKARGVTKVDCTRADRAPLPVIMGGEDHVVPPTIGKALVKRYQRTASTAVVEYKEFFALDWALARAVARP